MPYTDRTRLDSSIQRSSVVVIGPGLGRDDLAFEIALNCIKTARKEDKWIVIDAVLFVNSRMVYRVS